MDMFTCEHINEVHHSKPILKLLRLLSYLIKNSKNKTIKIHKKNTKFF